jgi:hypothetical protein
VTQRAIAAPGLAVAIVVGAALTLGLMVARCSSALVDEIGRLARAGPEDEAPPLIAEQARTQPASPPTAIARPVVVTARPMHAPEPLLGSDQDASTADATTAPGAYGGAAAAGGGTYVDASPRENGAPRFDAGMGDPGRVPLSTSDGGGIDVGSPSTGADSPVNAPPPVRAPTEDGGQLPGEARRVADAGVYAAARPSGAVTRGDAAGESVAPGP